MLDAFAAGGSVKVACEYAGIAESTFFDEQARNVEFADQVTRARGRAKVRNLLLIQQAAPSDWKAAQAALQLMDPDEYGQRLNLRAEQRVEIVQVILTAITEAVELAIPDPAVRVRVAEAIGARISAAMGGPTAPALPALPAP